MEIHQVSAVVWIAAVIVARIFGYSIARKFSRIVIIFVGVLNFVTIGAGTYLLYVALRAENISVIFVLPALLAIVAIIFMEKAQTKIDLGK